MRVTVFGSGYVGLVTGVCLAEAGNHVLCVDIDPAKVDRLKQGSVPIYEPGLDDVLHGADALAIVTEEKEFRSPDFERIKELLKQPVIFDGRNLYDPDFVRREGFQYFAIGRGDRVEPSRENAG